MEIQKTMAQASERDHTQKPASVIISPKFCSPLTIHLTITKKLMTLSSGNFTVTDPLGKTFFNVKAPFFSCTGRRVMYDAAGNPIVTIRRKVLSVYKKWEVFRGRELIFSAKGTFLGWSRSGNVDVFLARNVREEVRDFEMKVAWTGKACSIYAGESSATVAQMKKRHAFRTPLDTKDEFLVTVAPNVDYAFIVALIIILDEINSSSANTAAAIYGSM